MDHELGNGGREKSKDLSIKLLNWFGNIKTQHEVIGWVKCKL